MWQLKNTDKEKEARLISKQTPKLLARLLSQRAIPEDNIQDYLDKDYNKLSHPHTLNDVDKASRIFCQTVLDKKSIAVIGDYDCDGIMSSVMVSELCSALKAKCKVFLPSRFEEGYGLNKQTLEAFKEFIQEPPYLLIVVDSGSNNEEEIKMLREYGVQKIIIIDHHNIDESKLSKSADALINWHLSNHHEMCASGEVYQFIRGIRCLTKKIDPLEFLSYAAIGTVADVMPIIGDNRIIVYHGLKKSVLNKVTAFGLSALIKQAKLDYGDLSQMEVAFQIAPPINAVGRLESPRVALDLLLASDVAKAGVMAEHLIEQNNKRKKLQQVITNSAMSKAKELNASHGILVFNTGWNIGLVGIVASKLVDKFHKPCVVLGEHEGEIKGSGRSIEGIDLIEILNGCKEMFTRYGGHSLAGGVTLKREYLEKASALFDQACARYHKQYNKPVVDKIHHYDACLKIKAVTSKMSEQLSKDLYPYCNTTNPEPVFCLKEVKVTSAELIERPTWKLLKFEVAKDGENFPYELAFFTQKYGAEISGRIINLYFSFPQTCFDAKKLIVKDIELLKKTS